MSKKDIFFALFVALVSGSHVLLGQEQPIDLKFPFANGETWHLTRGYNPDNDPDLNPSHLSFFSSDERFALDFALPGCGITHRKPTLAAEEGRVTVENASGYGDGWGVNVWVWHLNGCRTRYAHMVEGSLLVESGEWIEQGEVMGLVGNTGNTESQCTDPTAGSHIHIVYQCPQWNELGEIEMVGLPPEPMSGATGFAEGQNHTSNNGTVAGYWEDSDDPDTDPDGWRTDGTSMAIYKAYFRNRRELGLPADDPDQQNSRFVHCWLDQNNNCTGVDVQAFYNDDLEKRGAVLLKQGEFTAYVIRSGINEVFRYERGPEEFGYLMSDEHPEMIPELGCPNGNVCPAVQLTQRRTPSNGPPPPLGAFVYNPNWDEALWPNGIVRYCSGDDPYGNCNWQPVVENIQAAMVTGAANIAGFRVINSDPEPFSIVMEERSYNRIRVAIDNQSTIGLQDLAFDINGVEHGVTAPAAVGYTFLDLNPETNYTITMRGIVRDIGTMVTSDPIQVTTLPGPNATVRLSSGVRAVGTEYPDAFQLGGCVPIVFELENSHTETIQINSVRPYSKTYDGDFTYTNHFTIRSGSPLVTLAPGQRYTYTGDNCGNPFADDYFPDLDGRPAMSGEVIPAVTIAGAAGLWDVTDVSEGSSWLNYILYDTFDLPNVSISEAQVSPNNPTTADQITVNLVVFNDGPASNINQRLMLVVDEQTEHLSPQYTVPANSATVVAIDIGSLAAGLHHLGYTADSGTNVPETNENNNTGSSFFTVVEPSDPDPDADSDGVPDANDNCPETANADQTNADSDPTGDACDDCPLDANNDIDNDGVCGDTDNCPVDHNPAQVNTDGDAKGDVCDQCPADIGDDSDGDSVCDSNDNCPSLADSSQADADQDGLGDVCDVCPNDALNDADQDGICADTDNCPETTNPDQSDSTGNGIGDVCEGPDVSAGTLDVHSALVRWNSGARDTVRVYSSHQLATNSNGIDPLTETFTLTVTINGFGVVYDETLPAGDNDWSYSNRRGRYTYNSSGSGITSVILEPETGRLNISTRYLDLVDMPGEEGDQHLVTIKINIGDDFLIETINMTVTSSRSGFARSLS